MDSILLSKVLHGDSVQLRVKLFPTFAKLLKLSNLAGKIDALLACNCGVSFLQVGQKVRASRAPRYGEGFP